MDWQVAQERGGLTQWLLLEDEEAGVDQLQVFGQVVELLSVSLYLLISPWGRTHIVQNNQLISPSTLVRANGKEDSTSCNRGQQLLHKQRQQDSRNGSEVKVVDLEEEVQLQWLAFPHNLASTEDDDVVGDQHRACRNVC